MSDNFKPSDLALAYRLKNRKAGPMSKEMEESSGSSVAAKIMKKRHALKMADGGEVEQDDESLLDDQDADLKENYDSETPQIEEDMDMVSQIRKKMLAKRGY